MSNTKEGTSETSPTEEEFWLFGYGSLIWKPPPSFDRRVPGYVTGYVRRFWQASEDHRGTPENPGRVVTLIARSFWETLDDHHPSKSDKVWGTAYRIEADKVKEVKDYLDIREINGYTVHYTTFHPAPSTSPSSLTNPPTIKTLVYIGTPENAQFLGPQDPQVLAEHIYKSHGPSGPNVDYLLSLEVALDNLSPLSGDEHIKDLANRIRGIQKQAEQAEGKSIKAGELEEKALEGKARIIDEEEGVDDGDGMEEIEKL